MRLARRVFGVLGLVAACASLAGCLTSDTLIKLRADGTGTVEQTILVNRAAFEQFGALAGQMLGGEVKDNSPAFPSADALLDEAKLREAATRLGKGVRYVSSAPLKRGPLEGATATFAFDDVNTLNVSQSPEASPGRAGDPMQFRLERRAEGAVLSIVMNDPEDGRRTSAPADEHAAPQMPPEALALIKPMLQGLHVAIGIDIDGTILKTNADHVSGNRVTLLDIDLDPLLDDPKAFDALASLGTGVSIASARPVLKSLPGVKVNASPSVTIEFR